MQYGVQRTITIKADIPAYGGLAIGRLEGKVVLIRGAIPGETVEAAVEIEKKDFCKATVTKILEPSPDRLEPPCVYFGRCGGCQLQYISHARQVRLKEEVLKSSLKRMAGLEVELSEPMTGPDLHYRRRARFKLSRGAVGFYKDKSHEVVDIESCPLMANDLDRLYKAARQILKGIEATELHISCGGSDAVAVVTASRAVRVNWDTVANAFLSAGFSGVSVELGGGRPRTYSRGYITLDLNGLSYTVSAAGFFQANWGLNRAAVRLVTGTLGGKSVDTQVSTSGDDPGAAVRPLEGLRVVDLYSGAGNFALPLARAGAVVTAVEEHPRAVEDGVRNLRLNGISGCGFVRANADNADIPGPVDILVVDPPRAGISDGAMGGLLSLDPARLVYMSCDPATFSRDIKRLGAKYNVESVRLVDFFPQTYHIESLAFLRLR
ncbi:MAG: class I SAM-dependent RNA methyltransferase [Nitrospirae bacterium]|nr:class I SAM-dependent RNA methyltransferase [Nitrospirota bacterium]